LPGHAAGRGRWITSAPWRRAQLLVAGPVLALAVFAAALLAPAARADIIAATEVRNASLNYDIALIDTATGTQLGLPEGINTSANEMHPSITPDGKRLVFSRIDHADVEHIVVADLATGTQADLFNAFEIGQYAPSTPTITPDGKKVITGANDQQVPGSSLFEPTWIETDISSFPNGPFPHVIRTQPTLVVSETGLTRDPAFDPSIGVTGQGTTAVTWERTGVTHDGIIDSVSGKNTNVFDTGHSLSHPALSKADNILLYDSDTSQFETDLVYRTLRGDGSPSSSPFLLPGTHGIDAVNLDPTFTADGHYVVYKQQSSGSTGGGAIQKGHIHLLVYDTSTGMLLDPNGLDISSLDVGFSDLGGFDGLRGGLSVYETFFLKSTGFTMIGGNALVSFLLNEPTNVGILVERIVGHHKLFGRRVPTLRKIGKVPFGHFRRGSHHVAWDLVVNGHRLRPGNYLIIPRALASNGNVRETGKPHLLRVR